MPLRGFVARALDRVAELRRPKLSALEARLGDLELRAAMPLYFVTIYRAGRREALYFTIVNAWDAHGAVKRADKRIAALTAQGVADCVAAAFECNPGHFYDAKAAVHADRADRHPYVEHPSACEPPDACKTHGRCWTHSSWEPKDPPTSAAYLYSDRPNEYDPPTPAELAEHARRKAMEHRNVDVTAIHRRRPHGDWLAKIEALKSGDPCEYREYGKWLPGTVVENNLAELWHVRDVAGQVYGIAIEHIRLPGQEEAWR